MRRRDVLGMASASLMGRWLAGCDKLVVVDPRLDPEIDPVTSNQAFYTYQCCGIPEVDAETHETSITVLEQQVARFDLAFLRSLELVEKEHTLQCVGSRPRIQNIDNAIWGGLPLRDVLDALGVDLPGGLVDIRVTGMDDYHAAIPFEDLDAAPLWLVWEMNGEPLPRRHGAPARLLVPGRYGVKNLKWLREIAFLDTNHQSYWTERGWDEASTYKPNTFIASPIDQYLIERGQRIRFVGTAFAGPDVIERVEVSVDGGPWEPADIDYAPGPDIWCLWSWLWAPDEPGDHLVQVRCTTASGAMSELDPDGTRQAHGYDGSMQIGVTVTG